MDLREMVRVKTTIVILGILFFTLSIAFFFRLYLDEGTTSVIKIETIWWYALGCVTAFSIQCMFSNNFGTRGSDLRELFKNQNFLLVSSVAIAIGLTVLFFSHWQIHGQIRLRDILAKDPPMIFSLVLGYLTILGVYANYITIHEQKTIITSFHQLIDRLVVLIKDGKGTVHIFAYTPAIGFLALDESYWTKLSRAIEDKVKNKGDDLFKIICLDKTELKKWHLAFKERKAPRGHPSDKGELTETTCEEATDAANSIIKKIHGKTFTTGKKVVKYHPFNTMPSYYVFFCEDRAISISPLALPMANGNGEFKLDHVPSTSAIQMLGFETIDYRIISDIRDHFYRYWKTGKTV